MVGARGKRSDRVYELRDPTLRSLDHALGTLSVDGEVEGYLACVVSSTDRGPLPWFVVAWPDGSKEPPFEDYGPSWWTVRELDAGRLEHFGPSTRTETRFLGFRMTSTQRGAPRTFDFAWLPADEAAQKWGELGLEPSDF